MLPALMWDLRNTRLINHTDGDLPLPYRQGVSPIMQSHYGINPSAVPGSALPPGRAWQLQKGTGGLSPGQQFKQESLATLGTPSNPIPGSLP